MKKFIEFVKKHAFKLLAVIFFILYMGQGCTNKSIKKTNDHLTEVNGVLSSKIDSLGIVITKHQITSKDNKVMLEDMMWKFLEYEEMSDKNNIPINKLKSDHVK